MRSGFDALGRLRLQAVLLLAAVFAIGVLGGIALERSRGGRPEPRHMPPPKPRELPFDMGEGLELSAEQETLVQAILDRYRPRMMAIMDESFPRMQAVHDSARREIRALLRPDQQEIFDRQEPPPFGDGPQPPCQGPAPKPTGRGGRPGR